ncbi:MAG: DUF3875 domain-containing protein, partial [Dyadobacter sp.]
MEKLLNDLLPVLDIEHGCILSKQGDMTMVFQAELPEIFTLSDTQYGAFHQTWVKAIKMLPVGSVLQKQDWFIASRYAPDRSSPDASFLTQSSETFFTGRPFLDHSCYLMLTKKPQDRKVSSSLFSNLIRPSLVPAETLSSQALHDFLDSAGQFRRILEDSGFVKLR